MAKEPKHASAPKIQFDALAETMVPDPATITDSVALAGFVGRSAEEGNIRLYVDAGFRNYYEISSSDILHSQQLPTTQSPLGGSVVYVRSSAPLRRVQVSTEVEARFLQGPMSSVGTGAASAFSPTGVNRALFRLPHATLIAALCDPVTLRGVHCVTSAPTSCEDLLGCGRPKGGDTGAFDC
jgi:hypothetical protein